MEHSVRATLEWKSVIQFPAKARCPVSMGPCADNDCGVHQIANQIVLVVRLSCACSLSANMKLNPVILPSVQRFTL